MHRSDPHLRLDALAGEGRPLREHLEELAVRAGNHLGRGTECAVTLRRGPDDRVAVPATARSAVPCGVELAQGWGPGEAAADALQVVLVADVRDVARVWPAWADAALRVGFGSVAAFPAVAPTSAGGACGHQGPGQGSICSVGSAGGTAGGAPVGVDVTLVVYRDTAGPWRRDAFVLADTFAQTAADVVGLAVDAAELAHEVRRLRQEAAGADVVQQGRHVRRTGTTGPGGATGAHRRPGPADRSDDAWSDGTGEGS